VMKCIKVKDMFSSYMENTMARSLSVEFEQHLAKCPQCKAEYDRFCAAVTLLEDIPEVEPPVDFHAKVMERVQQQRRTAPSRVKWWQIDWQHVFTIQVHARAAAMGAAILLLAVMGVQLTPLHSVVGSFFGVQQAPKQPIAERNIELAPRWSPWSRYSAGNSELSISVAAASNNAYDIRLGSRDGESIAYTISGVGKYSGVVATNQDSVVRAKGPAVANLIWRYKGQAHNEYIFLPAKFDPKASSKSLSITMQDTSVRGVLSNIAEKYGVVILASGNINNTIPYAVVQEGNPYDALYSCLEQSGMKSRALADSVYVVEPLK